MMICVTTLFNSGLQQAHSNLINKSHLCRWLWQISIMCRAGGLAQPIPWSCCSYPACTCWARFATFVWRWALCVGRVQADDSVYTMNESSAGVFTVFTRAYSSLELVCRQASGNMSSWQEADEWKEEKMFPPRTCCVYISYFKLHMCPPPFLCQLIYVNLNVLFGFVTLLL